MDEEKKKKIKEQLDAFHSWPSIYVYKFIFLADSDILPKLKQIFPEEVEYSTKTSSNRKYISLTIKEMVLEAEVIFQRYEDVSKLEGVISL